MTLGRGLLWLGVLGAVAVVVGLAVGGKPAVEKQRTPDGATWGMSDDTTVTLNYSGLKPDSIRRIDEAGFTWRGRDAVRVRIVVYRDGAVLREDTVWRRP